MKRLTALALCAALALVQPAQAGVTMINSFKTFASGAAGSGTATLTWPIPSWDASGAVDSTITGFIVRWGQTSGGPYTGNSATLGAAVVTYTTPSLATGRWYFVVETQHADAVSNWGPEEQKDI